jgi:hypothetical protein
MVKVFLSYHHNDRKLAAGVKECLSGLGMNVFMAHQDLEPSTEWQEEILKNLRKCDVFMPLLTKRFHSSNWTDQETGIAFASEKFILPLKVSPDPYGFIGKLQALKVRKELEETCRKIVQVLASRPVLADRARDGLIDIFLRSTSFEESARLAAALLKLKPYSTSQLNRIVQGAAKNQQIYGGRRAREPVNELIRENRPNVRRKLVREFAKQVESWPY